jgi:hypothetical protein
LSKNQIDGRFAMSYLLTNNINGYRKYISWKKQNFLENLIEMSEGQY